MRWRLSLLIAAALAALAVAAAAHGGARDAPSGYCLVGVNLEGV